MKEKEKPVRKIEYGSFYDYGYIYIDDTKIPFLFLIDRFVGYSLYADHVWEPHTTQTFINILKGIGTNDAIFLDIGAHWGYYSVIFANLFLELEIHAFEPMEFNIDILQKNADKNPAIIVHPFAIAEHEETTSILANRLNTAENTLLMSEKNADFIETTCHTAPLESFSGIDWNKIRFVKVDVERKDPEVLKQISHLLPKGTIVMVEVSRETSNAMLQVVKEEGYEICSLNTAAIASEGNAFLKKL